MEKRKENCWKLGLSHSKVLSDVFGGMTGSMRDTRLLRFWYDSTVSIA